MMQKNIVNLSKSFLRPRNVRFVGLDWNNRSGRFKFEQEKKELSKYPENIKC